jgi:hypothetical protein
MRDATSLVIHAVCHHLFPLRKVKKKKKKKKPIMLPRTLLNDYLSEILYKDTGSDVEIESKTTTSMIMYSASIDISTHMVTRYQTQMRYPTSSNFLLHVDFCDDETYTGETTRQKHAHFLYRKKAFQKGKKLSNAWTMPCSLVDAPLACSGPLL